MTEEDARERAIKAFYSSCNLCKDGECHAFIVGYETPDDRLHEKCETERGTNRCSLKIDNFLKHYDNE
jgi:hypothetical protein